MLLARLASYEWKFVPKKSIFEVLLHHKAQAYNSNKICWAINWASFKFDVKDECHDNALVFAYSYDLIISGIHKKSLIQQLSKM